MVTWKQRFNELSSKQEEALEQAKNATSREEWIDATKKLKESIQEINAFLKQYETAGSPPHDKEI